MPPAAPIPMSHAGGSLSLPTHSPGGQAGSCSTRVCTRMCERLPTRAHGVYHATGTRLPAVIRASTGCDCQAESEGLEILGRIIRFHIVTAAAIGGSGRLIPPSFLLFAH